jgi:hypothetical protein
VRAPSAERLAASDPDALQLEDVKTLAIFVNPEMTRTVQLTSTLPERVEVARTFVLRPWCGRWRGSGAAGCSFWR